MTNPPAPEDVLPEEIQAAILKLESWLEPRPDPMPTGEPLTPREAQIILDILRRHDDTRTPAIADGVGVEVTLDDVLTWADDIRSAMGTEYANRVPGREVAIAYAIYLAADTPPQAETTNTPKGE